MKTFHFDEVHSDLLPDSKLDRLQALRAEVNDTSALAAADAPVATGSGTDIAQESAGVLLSDDLLKLVELIALARRCRTIILFNFAGTLLVDAAEWDWPRWGLPPSLTSVRNCSSS